MQKFTQGDIVRLISGSPNMTVQGYEESMAGAFSNHLDKQKGRIPTQPRFTEKVICVWFEGSESKKDKFHQNLLELVQL